MLLLAVLSVWALGASTARADLVLIGGCRLLDTREPSQGPALVGQTTRDVDVRGECGIPQDATGLEYRATIVNPDAPGYLTLYPSDEAQPVVSSLNFAAGDVLGTGGVAKLGATEPSLSAYLATAPLGQMADLVLDVTGYHVPSRAVNVAGRLSTVSSAKPSGVMVDRWTENGDGTVTDRLTGLMWEMKTGTPGQTVTCDSVPSCSDPHDVNNVYTWSTGNPWDFDGAAATVFLAQLNTPPCFSDSCDWRLPTIDELQTLIEPASPDCSSAPCTTIPGATASTRPYWSSSSFTGVPGIAWDVSFSVGFVDFDFKNFGYYVRAVRGGS